MEWIFIALAVAYIAAAPDPVSAGARGAAVGAARSGSTQAVGSMRSGWQSGRRGRALKRRKRWARWQNNWAGTAAVWVERGLRGAGRGLGSALVAGGRGATNGARSGWTKGRADYRPIPDRVRSRRGRVDPDDYPDPEEDPYNQTPDPEDSTGAADSDAGRVDPAPTGTETGMADASTAVDVEIESYEDLDRELAEVERGWNDDGEPLMEAAKALMEAWADHYEGAVEAVDRGRALHGAATDGEEFVPGQTVLDALEELKEVMDGVVNIVQAVNDAAEEMDVIAATPDQVTDVLDEAVKAARDEHEDVEDTAVRTGAKVRLDAVAS
jgi:hypothetical protein